MTITASRPTLMYSTFLDVMVDSTATLMITYALAIPASVLVEIPMQRFLDYLI
ncbi:hypothetical protein K1T71_011425 [Dendrolimus kikuchii]|uniref:Uncharacterized protein n=1 Tax=Dendrolimus kikuchii TaxID=765133 RepID=A0ACC1CNS3_9NEOP|nr:hypothetical protein K1T71_011425 [Dendrolimus kikuchii]